MLVVEKILIEKFCVSDVKDYVKYIEKAVSTKEPRFMSRVARGINSVRHRLNSNILRRLLQGYIQAQSQTGLRDDLLAFLDEVRITVVSLYTVLHNSSAVMGSALAMSYQRPL